MKELTRGKVLIGGILAAATVIASGIVVRPPMLSVTPIHSAPASSTYQLTADEQTALNNAMSNATRDYGMKVQNQKVEDHVNQGGVSLTVVRVDGEDQDGPITYFADVETCNGVSHVGPNYGSAQDGRCPFQGSGQAG